MLASQQSLGGYQSDNSLHSFDLGIFLMAVMLLFSLLRRSHYCTAVSQPHDLCTFQAICMAGEGKEQMLQCQRASVCHHMFHPVSAVSRAKKYLARIVFYYAVL